MPQTVTKTVYTFGELLQANANGEVGSKAVKKARAWMQEGATMGDYWHEYILEDWKTALAQVGFADAEIEYSGFWSQGDGANFTANLDIPALIAFFTKPIKGDKTILDGEPGGWLPYVVHKVGQTINPRYEWLESAVNHLSGRVERINSHYSHENTCSVCLNFDHPRVMAEVHNLVDEFAGDVENLRNKLCRVIYRALESEYEYRTDDAQLIEDSDCNDYTFDASGDRMQL